MEQNLKMIIEDKCKIPEKKVFTEDRILPLDTYNPSDCTNDNSCIIQPDKYNLSPGFKKIENKNLDKFDFLIKLHDRAEIIYSKSIRLGNDHKDGIAEVRKVIEKKLRDWDQIQKS